MILKKYNAQKIDLGLGFQKSMEELGGTPDNTYTAFVNKDQYIPALRELQSAKVPYYVLAHEGMVCFIWVDIS